MSWYNDSRRHSLARKGIKTNIDGTRRFDVSNFVSRGEINQNLINKAIEKFGLTDDFLEAGFILPDGTMLDFSGKNIGGIAGKRALDHRDITTIDDDLKSGTNGMEEFMDMTNSIRYELRADQHGINTQIQFYDLPTSKQLRTLKDSIEISGGDVNLDMQKGIGEWDEHSELYFITDRFNKISLTYPTGSRTGKIIGDIKSFYLTDDPILVED